MFAKSIIVCLVAAVLVCGALAQEPVHREPEQLSAGINGSIRAFGRKIVDSGSSILSHIPIVNKFFGDAKKNQTTVPQEAAPAQAAAPVAPEKPAAETPAAETPVVETPATEAPAAKAPAEEAPAAEPAQEEPAKKVEESSQ